MSVIVVFLRPLGLRLAEEKKTTVIPSVRGDRRGTGLVAESGLQRASTCGINAVYGWFLLLDWRNSMCKADPLLDTTSPVSIEP